MGTRASYLRGRLVPEGGIFSDKTPTIRPTVPWLTTEGLLALVNASALDFLLRTFLGSRMQLELGDVRRVPVPVLTQTQHAQLDLLGCRAVVAKAARDRGEAAESLDLIEAEIDGLARELYGIAPDVDLWVVR
ncbi:MAG: hypothetical protein ACLQBX_14160 [Candidatus Limnocylindrales bacterium]